MAPSDSTMYSILLLVASSALLVIALLNRVYAKSWKYPPAIFSAWWAFLILSLAIAGELFYRISVATIFVFIAGAISFSVGGAVALRVSRAIRAPVVGIPGAHRILRYALMALIGTLPIYWSYIVGLSAATGLRDFWYGVRVQAVKVSDLQATGVQKSFQATVMDNVATLSLILALVSIERNDGSKGSRLQICVFALVAFLYLVLQAANGGVAALLLGAFGVHWIRNKRLSKRLVVSGIVFFVFIFGAVSVFVKKGNTNLNAGLLANIAPGFEVLEMYAVGGLVAFNQVVESPSSILNTWSVWRFFELTANKFGADWEIPPLGAAYTGISQSAATNVYTLYFPYFVDYGLPGTCFIMIGLGVIATVIYGKALKGTPEAVVFYGLTVSGIILSGFNEQVFAQLNMFVKVLVVSVCIYRIPILVASRQRRSGRLLDAKVAN